jgi:glycosyltransferase involved in cell wall biosynthesis
MKPKVVHYIDSKEFGGAEESLSNLLSSIDSSKWQPTLFHHPSPGISRLIEKIRKLKVDIVCLPKIRNAIDIKNMWVFVKEIKRIRPMAFHAHLPWYLRCSYGIICAYVSSVPAIIVTQHAYKKIPTFKLSLVQKLISIIVDCYIAVSQGIADNLKEAIFFNNRLKVIHNGICIERFSRVKSSTLITSLKNNRSLPVVINVARMDNHKGHTYLIKAAAMTPEALFVLAGDGPQKQEFEQQAAQLGIDDRIVFLGQREDIPELLYSSDLFILPSLIEGLPLTILEAMAAGKPVIATAIDGIEEIIVSGENGILVPVADPGAISKSIQFLLSNPSAAQKLATSGKQTVLRDFTSEKMAEDIITTYVEILTKKAPQNYETS